MKIINSVLTALIFAGLVEGCSPDTSKPKMTATHQALIVLDPALKGRQTTLVDLTTWLTRHSGYDVHVFDGGTGIEITHFVVPELTYFRESAVAERIGQPLQKLIAWAQETRPASTLDGTGGLDIPKAFERISESYPAPERLIVLGSPIYKSSKGTNDDFFVGHFRTPSLGHIRAADAPFSAVGMEKSLAGTRVYFLYPSEDTSKWPAEYEKHLRKFYSAFVKSRGGVLVAFSPDLDAGLLCFDAGTTRPIDDIDLASCLGPAEMTDEDIPRQPEAHPQTNSTALPLLAKASTPATVALITTAPSTNGPSTNKLDFATNAVPAKSATPIAVLTSVQPAAIPAVQPGTFVELRYPLGAAAASLHVRPYPGAVDLTTGQFSSPDGWYSEQIDYSTGEVQKWVYFPGGCDARQAEVWINYSGGTGSLSGKLRWITPKGQTVIPFLFPVGSVRWLRVNLIDVVAGKVVWTP
jgi:hypothetical protein